MVLTHEAPRPSPAQTARRRYVADAVTTVSPAGLVTMLYDGLISDLERAELAIGDGDVKAAHDRLVRAQAIVLELRAGLKPELWAGGPALAALYAFFTEQLVRANLAKDRAVVSDVRRLVEPLRAAWHGAAAQLRAAP